VKTIHVALLLIVQLTHIKKSSRDVYICTQSGCMSPVYI